MSPDQATAINRASWDRRVQVHLASELYRPNLAAVRGGGGCLDPEVAGAIGEVGGLDVLHLQCHIGLDTISLARRGATTVGLDFSEPAIEVARGLAAECGVEAEFVVFTVADAPTTLPGRRFDRVVATEGILCWIADLAGWMRSAATMLRPGGRLVLLDGHQAADIFENDPTARHGIDFHYGYFDRTPTRFGPGPSYADDGTSADVGVTVEYQHTLGDIVNTAIQAGLRIDRLDESPQCGFAKFTPMRTADGRMFTFTNRLDGMIPMRFALHASLPG
jgi:SAM-dependent methyltransferase